MFGFVVAASEPGFCAIIPKIFNEKAEIYTMSDRLTDIIAHYTFGKNYRASMYSINDLALEDSTDSRIWKRSAESSMAKPYTDLRALSRQLASSGEQVLTYFLDGSRRIFKTGEIEYDRIIYPIMAGQIYAGCCRRADRKLFPEALKHEIVVALPNKSDKDGKPGFFPGIAQKLSESPTLKRRGLEISAVLPYSSVKDSRNTSYDDKATAAIQDRMIQCEKEITGALVRKLNHRNYLIKDGSLEYRKKSQLPPANYRWVIGLSKSFSPEACKNVRGKPDPSYIAGLPPYHRTQAACVSNPEILGEAKFAVWYIRLHERMDSAFAGIVKAERMLVTQSEQQQETIDSAEIDMISAYILNERSPVCYGNDTRWASHIYPVYLTEKYIKSKYISSESFLQLF